MKNTNSSHLRLPDEIVDDILLCQPVKSLKRFKLVSKPWNSLISNPNFAQSHLNRSNTLISQGDRVNLLRLGKISISKRTNRPYGQGPRPSLSLDSMDADGSHREVVAIDLGLQHYSDYPSILGSCNGLLLVSFHHLDFFLLNPSTRQYKKISSVHLDIGARVISGLGYESTSRNYKGIIVTHSCGGPSSPHIIEDYVYDYNLNKWKRRHEFHYGVNYYDTGSAVMVNGNPHWCVYRAEDGKTYDVIVYVDLKTEEFKEVELPVWAVTPGIKFHLGVLGGCLCMSLHPQGSSTSIEVWTMKEYRIRESWTELFVINSSFFRQLLMRPICFTETGRNKVLMQGTNGEFIIFNLKEELEKLLALYRHRVTVCTYVESLVFPEQDGNEAELPQFGGNPIMDSDTNEMDYDADEIDTTYRLDHQKVLERLERLDRLDHQELLDYDADEIGTAYMYRLEADEISRMDGLDHLDCDADEICNADQELLDCDGDTDEICSLDHQDHCDGRLDHQELLDCYADEIGTAYMDRSKADEIGNMDRLDRLDCDADEICLDHLKCDPDKIGNADQELSDDADEIHSLDHQELLDCDGDEIGNLDHQELLDCDGDADEIGSLDHQELLCDGDADEIRSLDYQELLDCDVDEIGAADMCCLDREIGAAYMGRFYVIWIVWILGIVWIFGLFGSFVL